MAKTCWAEILGNCSGVLSKEHIVSECLFKEGEKITISGVDWAPEKRQIPAATAYAYILCKTHNEKLSVLDQAAKDVKTAFIYYYDNAQKFFESKDRIPKDFAVNGKLFERWILKTTINHLMYSPDKYKNYKPDPYLIKIAYGLEKFDYSQKQGLYFVDPSLQNNIMYDPRLISVFPIILDHEQRPILLGTLIKIFGFSFFLKMVSTKNMGIRIFGINLIDEKYYHHPEIALLDNGKYNNTIKLIFSYNQEIK